MATVKVKNAAGNWVDAMAIAGDVMRVGELKTAQVLSSGGGATITLDLSQYIGTEDNVPFVMCWNGAQGSRTNSRQMLVVNYDGSTLTYYSEGSSGLTPFTMNNGPSLDKGILSIQFYSVVYPTDSYSAGSYATLIYVN